MSASRNIPPLFTQRLAKVDSGLATALVQALSSTDPVVSVRHNPLKGGAPGAGADLVPWCSMGEYLGQRPQFTLDPAFHQGRYYVQDASSMFIAYVIGQLGLDGPVDYLDACAAPGGKTTAAISALPMGSRVVANEYDPRRAAILRENLSKWGYPYVCVTQGSTGQFLDHPRRFDIIAADVPCSGEGMMRKDAEAVAQWSTALVGQCADRQREIISNLWPALRPGGYLIYSTCTFNREENEDILRHMASRYGAEPVHIAVPDGWGIHPALDDTFPAYRFFPHLLRGEGLFMAVLRKPHDAAATRRGGSSKHRQGRSTTLPDAARELKHWLDPQYQPALEYDGDTIFATPSGFQSDDTLRPRIPVAVVKGRSLIPTQELAMSMMLHRGAFAEVEIDLDMALNYLRREAIQLPEDSPRGLVLLTYRSLPLGFVKNLGNRANNLYPANWRIRTL